MALLRLQTSVFLRISTILFFLILIVSERAYSIRIPNRNTDSAKILYPLSNQSLKTAVFALGSFWRSESVFGCLDGVVRTTVGYAGGAKLNPEYRSLGDHAESVRNIYGPTTSGFWLRKKVTVAYERVEYDPRLISFRQLLEVFWSSHDSRQVFGQGPDVGNQYRSIIFTSDTEESRLASVSKEKEQLKSRGSAVTTQVQELGAFYPAEAEHQKFELKRNPFFLQLMGNLPEEELEISTLAAKMNGYAADLCPPRIQKQFDAKINDIIKKGWPILREK